MVYDYSMSFEPAMEVTADESDVGSEAELALVVAESSSTSRRYSDSANSRPLTSTESRRTRNAWDGILRGLGMGKGGRPSVQLVGASPISKQTLGI
jgi:hypothetical protein